MDLALLCRFSLQTQKAMLLKNFYFNPYAIPFLASTTLFAFVGVYVLKQSMKSILHLSFFGTCLSLVIWLGATALLLCSQNPWWIRFSINVLYLGVSFISLSFFVYSSIWLKFVQHQKWWIIFGCIAAFIFTLIIWMTPWIVTGYMKHSWGYYSLLSPVGGGIYLAFFSFFMFFFFINLIKGYRQSVDDLKKRQLRIVFTGFFIGYIGSVDFLPCYGIEIFPMGAFTTLILVGTLSYTIVRYQLLNIQTVIDKSIMWALTSILVVVPIATTSYSAKEWINSLDQTKFSVLVFIILTSFIPYICFVQPKIDQWFMRRHWNLEKAFKEFADDLVHLKGLQDLASHILKVIVKTVYPKGVSLFLWNEGTQECLVFSNSNGFGKASFEMNKSFFSSLSGYDSLLQLDYVDQDPRLKSIQKEVREFFESTKIKICLPLVLNSRLIGVIGIKQKSNLKEYPIQELRFLENLRRSATIALENSRLYEDVIERSKRLQDMQTALFLAEKSAAMAKMAKAIGHEVNNPLLIVRERASLIHKTLLPEVRRNPDKIIARISGDLEKIVQSAKRIEIVVNTLTSIVREPSNQMQSLNFLVLWRESLEAARFSSQGNRISQCKIVENIAGNLIVYGNLEQLIQVFLNLVKNSCEAMGDQLDKQLVIEAGVDHENSKFAKIIFSDNGSGIPAETLPHIWEQGFTTKQQKDFHFGSSGQGQGLFVVRHIIEAIHGGRIEVESHAKKGTLFYIYLPVQNPNFKNDSMELLHPDKMFEK